MRCINRPAAISNRHRCERSALIANDSLRVEPYATPLKVLPIDEDKK